MDAQLHVKLDGVQVAFVSACLNRASFLKKVWLSWPVATNILSADRLGRFDVFSKGKGF